MSDQAKTFFILIGAGMAAGIAYDLIRIFRRIVRHPLAAIQLEDMLYWILLSVGVMLVLLWDNNGSLRFFSVMAPIIGMILYFLLLSDLMIRPAEMLIRAVRKILAVILHIFAIPVRALRNIILLPVRKVKNCLLKINKFTKNLLKKALKCAKINIRFSAHGLYDKADGRSDRLEKQTKEERKK